MTLKNAALLALVAMILETLVLAGRFILTINGVVQGAVPAMTMMTSFVQTFAALCLTVFLYVFYSAQGARNS